MLISFLSALALVFVFEGIMPFIAPEKWKKLLLKIIIQDERALRIFGLFSMLMGVVLLTIIHQFAE
ncbi:MULTISPECIES: DUF2065 domain-containing protein [Legionella]|uniref:DUF2065 domain-containing protein n=1 Tax=Legionella septentrionalis TaxID=2498109 RepID=A0A3S0VBN0_9GAMM|nr:DUF2065 domain-containing protein [Legionella septentrionalis]MCP0914071.1 DUF2065 domain-containing protein [Legionella sp. 27cVA30]RUQ90769.1 DUF2065 domain-containing protein [Legionella septentrionalis]RUQ99926.1 DUF2065 domain-containing protein [Legionella septentrionalis]RUR10230.1 DUF2065 domain-containing protein [Legionella septentrionalis]RUR15758.1 DUF2065 domain-containing protein [Legionella septentrionalis]